MLFSVNSDCILCSLHDGYVLASIPLIDCDESFSSEWQCVCQDVYFLVVTGDVVRGQVNLTGRITKECIEAMERDFYGDEDRYLLILRVLLTVVFCFISLTIIIATSFEMVLN